MPVDFNDPTYEIEGEEYEGGAGKFYGKPCDAFWDTSTFDDRTVTKLCMKLERSNPELSPAAKPYIDWSWNCGPDWTIDGDTIVHPKGDKEINANADLGKLFKALKAVEGVGALLPDGWSQKSAKSWAVLPAMEWIWAEEANSVRQPDGKFKRQTQVIKLPDGRMVDNPDWKPKRTMVPVALLGGAVDTAPFDVTSLGLDETALGLLTDAATKSANVDEMMNALHANGGLKVPAIMLAVNNKEQGERVRVALRADSNEPF